MARAQIPDPVVAVVKIPRLAGQDRPATTHARRSGHLRRHSPPYRLVITWVSGVHSRAAIHASRLITAQPSSDSSGHWFA
jgi:hypothetical protein